MGQKSLRTSMLLGLTFFAFNFLYSQTFDLQYIPKDKMQFGLSYNRTFYKNSSYMSILTSVYQLYLDIPIDSKINLIGNIQYASTRGNSYSANGPGNIFFGVQSDLSSDEASNNVITVGLYLPTASKDASYYRMISDYYYLSKSIPNSIGIYFNYAFHKLNAEGFSYGVEAGPDIISPISNKESTSPDIIFPTKLNAGTAEFFSHYGIITGYQVDQIALNLEFVGNVDISEDIQEFGDRFVNMLNVGVQWMGATVTSKIYYKIYLRNEIRQMVDGLLGIGVNLSIK
jgi:hypothetical protein